MSYISPVDGTKLLKVKNQQGEVVYRDKATGVEYTEAALEQQKADKARENKIKSQPTPSKTVEESPPQETGEEDSQDDDQEDEEQSIDLAKANGAALKEYAEANPDLKVDPKDYSKVKDLREALQAASK